MYDNGFKTKEIHLNQEFQFYYKHNTEPQQYGIEVGFSLYTSRFTCYLFQLRHPWERSLCTLSAYTMFNRTVEMFFNLTLALTTGIKLLFFAIRSNAMSLDEVHPKARAILKLFRTSLSRTGKRRCIFLPSKNFHRRTNFFHGSRHVFLKLIVEKRLVINRTRPPRGLPHLGRQYGGR